MHKGIHFISVGLGEVPVFIRKNKLLPLCRSVECIDMLDTSKFEIISYTDREITYTMYEDDGYSKNYDSPDNFVDFAITENDGQLGAVCKKTIVKLSLFQ